MKGINFISVSDCLLRESYIIQILQQGSGAPYPYRKEKENHELIFSWLSWLAVLLVGQQSRHNGGHGGVAQDGSYTPANRLTLRHAALFISSFFYWTSLLQSIDTCQNNISTDQYHMNIYCRLKVRSHCGHVFFLSQSLTKC